MFFQKEGKGIWEAYPKTFGIHLISVIRADKVLILAPHPDDDVIGAGGLINYLAGEGSEIKIVYFTDGSRSNRGANFSEALIEKREREARKAGKILGIGEQKFLRLPHNAMKSSFELSALIRREIEFDKPDLLLSPSIEEPHPDHLAVAQALALALRNYDQSLNIWLYEAFGTGRLNRLFEINEQMEAKKEALGAHKSQLAVRKYEEAIISLNRFRALSAGLSGHAEAFYAVGPRNYVKLFEFYHRHHESQI
ncbi:MAG: PIG-L family deacetylase [Patescibacteria group bacterium]